MTKRPYQGIDHVVLRLADAESLYALLSGPLGLPVTWPLERASFATFGWIGVGNTNLEIWAAASNSDLPTDCPFPLVHGIALEPDDLSISLAQLDAKGIRCKEPRAFRSKDAHGQLITNFTNSVVLDVSSDSCCVFFCEWDRDAPIAPWERGQATHSRRTKERMEMKARDGGPLGLLGLSEIALTARDVVTATEKWQKLSDSTGDPIALTEDVNLRLLEGTQDAQDVVQSLTFAVRDLTTAATFLADRNLLETSQAGEVLLSLKASGGLRLRFVEQTAT